MPSARAARTMSNLAVICLMLIESACNATETVRYQVNHSGGIHTLGCPIAAKTPVEAEGFASEVLAVSYGVTCPTLLG
jgi:hypothetical protein